MNVNLKGFKKNCGNILMGDFLIHRGRHLSERDTRVLVNYAIELGYKTIADVPDEIVDKCCDPFNLELNKYNDTPNFYTLDEIESAIKQISYKKYVNWDADDIIQKLREEL